MTPRQSTSDGNAELTRGTEQSRRGRRPRTPVDALVTQAWYSEVARRLRMRGINSNRSVERHFEPDKIRKNPVSGDWMRPCKFDKYHRGEHTPSLQVRTTVDNELPGTAAIFDLPLWRVIDRPVLGLSEIHAIMATFGIRLKAILFTVDRSVGTMQPVYRRRKLRELDYPEIRKQGDLEALACLLALARESEWTNDDAQHRFAACWAIRLLFALWIFPPLAGVAHGLWRYLKTEFFGRIYVDHAPLDADAFDVDKIMLIYTEILLRMEDAGVVHGYDFREQARLFWYADIGNLSTFLADARMLTQAHEKVNWKSQDKLVRKYRKLVRTPLPKIVKWSSIPGHP